MQEKTDSNGRSGSSSVMLPCPFCNESPRRSEENNGLYVRCDNDQCFVKVYAFGIVDHEKYTIRDWNKRAPFSLTPDQAGQIANELSKVAHEGGATDHGIGLKLLDVLIGGYEVVQVVSDQAT